MGKNKTFSQANIVQADGFFILISLYLTISFYQTFHLYSTVAILARSQIYEIREAITECEGNSSCLNQLDLNEIKITSFNPAFIIPQITSFVDTYNNLKTAKTVLYPLSDHLVYDYAIRGGFSYVLETDAIRVELSEADDILGGSVTPSFRLPIVITFDYAPVYAERFFLNVFVFVLYFYLLSCIINLIKKIISERIKSRFDAVYH